MTLKLLGKHLLSVLEHSVSLANETTFGLEQGVGRFLQVSGLRFTWNRKEDIGMRVVDVWVLMPAQAKSLDDAEPAERQAVVPRQWERLQMEQTYSITVNDWVAGGFDGYTMIPQYATDVVRTESTMETVHDPSVRSSGAMDGEADMNCNQQMILAALDAGAVTQWEGGRIANSTATRRTCIAPGTTDLCSGSGQCITGVCSCESGTGGQYCTADGASSSSSDTVGIVLGVVIPITFLLVVLAVIAGILLLIFMRYRRPKLILKVRPTAILHAR